jgi:uncharacterized membrane protein YgcG
MKLLAAIAALIVAAAAGSAPALARDSYVIDNAHLLSAGTISTINSKVADFNAQTHKEVFVDTEMAFTGTPQDAAERVFAQQQVNGVLIFIAKTPKTIGVVPDRAAAHFFPSGSTAAIRQAIVNAFNSGDYNGGVGNGVDLTLSEYRSHLGGLRSTTHAYAPVAAPAVSTSETGGGFNMGVIWWLIALAVIFFVVRGIFRAIAGPRMYPPGYGGGGPMGPMGGGYGPGYGGGGFGGGGGGFWSGMLGGLGGAFLGNELFGNRGGEMFNQGGQQAGFGDGGQTQDNSGFQSDGGQADMGNSSFGSWGGGGDSGGGGGWGGGDSGGGGGDFGGGGGGDSGGGGGW